jgi:hypothetical protein
MRGRMGPRLGVPPGKTRACYHCEINKFGGYDRNRGFIDWGGLELCPYDDTHTAEENDKVVQIALRNLNGQMLFWDILSRDEKQMEDSPDLVDMRIAVKGIKVAIKHLRAIYAECGPSELVRAMAEGVTLGTRLNNLHPRLWRRGSF